MDLIEQHPCVAAWINGHCHDGSVKRRGRIHFFTVKGMCETKQTSYAVITVHRDRLEVTGFGREENRVLPLSDD